MNENMINKIHLNVIPGDICFEIHKKYNLVCTKTICRQWFDNSENNNCVIIAAKKGPQNQEIVGSYFGLTRMRVCQIEKKIITKIKEQKHDLDLINVLKNTH